MDTEIPIIVTSVQQLLQFNAIKLKSWKGDYLHRPDSPQGVTTWNTGIGNQWTPCPGPNGTILLRSWKGDYLHRPDSPEGVTTWNTGVGNQWTVEFNGKTIRLKSWKGDYLHRPDSPQGVTTWKTGIGNEWYLEAVPSTVTFNQNFPSGCPSNAVTYSEAGLTFTNNQRNCWCSPSVNGFVSNYGYPSKLTVTTSQGKTFDFKSLQVCNANAAIPEQKTLFTGTRIDGTKEIATFMTPANKTAPQTFAPPNFTNLVSLTIDLGFVAFDNLVFVGKSVS